MAVLSCHEQDDGKAIEIQAGKRIVIDLKESPTTGYKWTDPLFDKQFLGLEANEFKLGPQAAVGGGGTRHLVFVAKLPGNTPITLINKRPWEGSGPPVGKFTIMVRIVK